MVWYFIAMVILSGGFVVGMALTGVSVSSHVDIPTLVLVGVVSFLLISTLYGFKEMANAFSSPFKKDNTLEDLARAFTFFQRYGKITWIMSLISIVIGFIGILKNLEETAKLGLSVLYGGLINVLLVIPFLLLIRRRQTKMQRRKAGI